MLEKDSENGYPLHSQSSSQESEENPSRWRCTVCGYIHDSDPLPQHFVCPQCGAPAPKFEKL